MPNQTTVEVPIEAIIEAAATFDAYGNLLIIAAERCGSELWLVTCQPETDLLRAAGFNLDNEASEGTPLRARLDQRSHEIAAGMLDSLAAYLVAEAAQERSFAAEHAKAAA